MQLESLRLLNFRQHERTELTLGQGVTAVVGPNGSGKSTLLEAIAWALYGTAAARGTRDTIKRRGAPPRARVEVEVVFALGMHRYVLTRTLTNAELSQDGHVIANSTATVTDRVTALLGMSREEFFNTYFTGQKELAVMAAMTPTERGQFLARVLGHERLRLAQDRLRAERSTRRAELAGLEQGLADPGALEDALRQASEELDHSRQARDLATAAMTIAETTVQTLAPGWTQARATRTAWQGLDGERRVAEGRVLEARTAFQALDRELAAAIEAGRRLEVLAAALTDWPTLVEQREVLDRQAALVTARSQAVGRRDAARARLETVVAELLTLPDEQALVTAREARTLSSTRREELSELASAELTRWKQDEQEARTKLEQYRDRYRELREQHQAISEAGPEGTCPFCARPLGADHERTLAVLASQMEEVEASGNYYRQRVEQLGQTPESVTQAQAARTAADQQVRVATETLAAIESGSARRATLTREAEELRARLEALGTELEGPAATYDAEHHEQVRRRLVELEPQRRQHDQVAGLAARASVLVAEAATAEQVATHVETVLADVDRRLTELGWDPEAFALLESRVEAARVAHEEGRVALATSSAAVDAALKLRDDALQRRADRREKAVTVSRLGATIERVSELDRAFGELRVILNQEMRPELQARAAEFLQALTDGRYADLEITEEYQVAIVDGSEVKPVISGGEEDVLNLALRLAISQMIAERAGQPLSLLVLDEIFGSLDEDRRHAVVDLLRALADRFPQVIVITHVESLRDVFDRVLRVSHDVERGVTSVHDDQPELLDVAI